MDYFQNKIIWITGASSGIGAALARLLSASGARLILSGRKESELIKIKLAAADPGDIAVLPFDLTDSKILEGKVAAAIDLFGHIDIMIHNGGIGQHSTVAETSMDVHRRVMEVDYFSYVALSRSLLPHFVERKNGHFVVISSVMGKIGTPMRSAYAAAKHALHGFFDCLRAEVQPNRVLVTLITPGYIRTNISMQAVRGNGSELGEMGENIAAGLPAEQAAAQIISAIRKNRFEAYVGRNSSERLALLVNRFSPGILVRLAPRFIPK